MLPRRGYEPVEDVDEDDITTQEINASNRRGDRRGRPSAYTSVPRNVVEPNARNTIEDTTVVVDDTGAHQQGRSSTASDAAVATRDNDVATGMAVRILDVQGQTYSLPVTPETTVRELKERLVEVAGVEIGRQRIIHGGKLLGDSDTLASRNISDGAVIHLFQRPKLSAFATPAAGGGAVSAQHPGRLHEIPPLLLQVQERGSSNLQAQGYLDTHWEIDVPRRGVRFLASFLLLISVMQLLECLASISAAMASSGGGAGDTAHPALPTEYWMLVRGRSLSSAMGIVVGVLGIRGSQSLSTQTIKMYFVGLVICAIMAMVIRIEVLYDVISGKIPFAGYGLNPPNSSDDYGRGPGDRGDGGDEGARGEEEGGAGAGGQGSDSDAESRMFTTFTAVCSVIVSGGVWLLCIRRVHRMRTEILIHMDLREQQQREMRQEQEQGRAASSVSRLEEGEVNGTG